MSGCCAYGCRNRPEYKVPGITFHLFPKDPARRRAWTAAVKRKNFVPTDFTKLCSEHFEEGCFDRTKKKVRLLADAIPSIFKTQSISSSGIETLTEFQNNGSVFKRSLSESDEEEEEEDEEEDDDENLFLNENEEEDDHEHLFVNENDEEDDDEHLFVNENDDEHLFLNENDEESTSSSSESSVEESEPEAAPETEVVYVSEEAPDANKPSIIKIVPGPGQQHSDPSSDPDVRSALQAYQRLRSTPAAPSPSVVSVLFVGPPHADALPPLPPGARPPGALEYRVWNQCKKIRALTQTKDQMVRKIRELERRVEQFRNPATSDEDEEEDVSEGEAYQLLLNYQREENS